MRPRRSHAYQLYLDVFSNTFFLALGILFSASSIVILGASLWNTFTCLFTDCATIQQILGLVSHAIIAAAIYDVGRYLLEEEVFRDRELRSPAEARRSLTKFMVIIVIAVTLESLLSVIKAGTGELSDLIYPAALFSVAVLLLVGLGIYQRLSVSAEMSMENGKSSKVS